MNDPAVYAVYLDGGWVDVTLTLAQMALTILFITLWERERRIRKTWQPMIDAMRVAVEAHTQHCVANGEQRDVQ